MSMGKLAAAVILLVACGGSAVSVDDMAHKPADDLDPVAVDLGDVPADDLGQSSDLTTTSSDLTTVPALDIATASADIAQPLPPDLRQQSPDLATAVCARAADCGGAPGFYCLDASTPNWLNACGVMTPKYETDVGAVCKRLVIQVEAKTLTSIQRWCGALSPSPGNYVTFQWSAAQYEYQVLAL